MSVISSGGAPCLLLRRTWSDAHFEELGRLLQSLMNRAAIAALRRALKPPTNEENEARMQSAWAEQWLREHPGRTRAEHDRSLRKGDGEVAEWRLAGNRAWLEAEQRAWEADHPAGNSLIIAGSATVNTPTWSAGDGSGRDVAWHDAPASCRSVFRVIRRARRDLQG